MKKFYLMLVLAFAIAPINSAHARGGSGASWLLGLDLSYLSSKVESVRNGNTTTNTDSTNTLYDLTFGGMVGSNLYVGAIYSTKSDKDLSTNTSASAMGASIGFVADSGVHLTASYFLSATDGDYKKGTGYEVDFGWRNFISSSFFVGAKLAMRSIKYTENETVSGFESLTHTTTVPYISLGLGF